MYRRLFAPICRHGPQSFQLARRLSLTTRPRLADKRSPLGERIATGCEQAPEPLRQLLAAEADTILYSSYVDSLTPGWRESAKRQRHQQRDERAAIRESLRVRPFSAALQFMQDDNAKTAATTTTETQAVDQVEESSSDEEDNIQETNRRSTMDTAAWMLDYESYKDPSADDDDENGETLATGVYGTPDATQPVSKVPCHGCGALLQCAEPSLPGYLPSEIFVGQKADYLKVG